MSCPDCFTGTVHDDETPKGQEGTVHGRKTYVTDPEGEPKGIIIIVPDAFGIDFVNNKLLADHYARKGSFKVYLPDFMDGRCAPQSLMKALPKIMDKQASLSNWLWKPYYIFQALTGFAPFMIRNRLGVSMPKVQAFVEAVRKEEGAHLPIGAAGFCWGGPHVFQLASGLEVGGKPLIDAGFTAHPSNLKIPADIEKVKKPTSVAIGDADFVLAMKGVEQIKEIFKRLTDVETEVVVYEGAEHGFAVRGDHKNEKEQKQAAEAEDQAVYWFKRVFAQVSH